MTRRILRWALRCGPRSFRQEFGLEIQADFEEGLKEARVRGGFAPLAFVLRSVWDVARIGFAERWERRRIKPRRSGTDVLQSPIGQDAKLAWRGLLRSPGFTGIAVIALALGIGANTAIFSVVNAVLLRPLPYERSEDLVRIWSAWTNFPKGGVSEPEYYDYQEIDSLESVGAFLFVHDATLAVEGGEPEPVKRTFVTASFFRVLGVQALHGRTFEDEENEPGKGDVVLLSHGLWQRRFGSDPGLVGKTIRVEARGATVVGILPPSFQYLENGVELWFPFTLIPDSPRPRAAHFMRVIGRLKEGASIESARTELAVVAARLAREFPQNYPPGSGYKVLILPLADDLVA
ncbi:MAG TPA: ABC transporter permease, partial [Vicinamibacteria bacterium]|nr:ABC transporter permease [Vicinamibacteria bacterium]